MLRIIGEVLGISVLFWIAVRNAYSRGKDIGFQSGKIYGWSEGWKASIESQKRKSDMNKEAGEN